MNAIANAIRGAPDNPDASAAAGTTNVKSRNSHFTLRSVAAARPWKNSRVLNEPPMKPCDFWMICGCLTPIAVCKLDFGRSRALR